MATMSEFEALSMGGSGGHFSAPGYSRRLFVCLWSIKAAITSTDRIHSTTGKIGCRDTTHRRRLLLFRSPLNELAW